MQSKFLIECLPERQALVSVAPYGYAYRYHIVHTVVVVLVSEQKWEICVVARERVCGVCGSKWAVSSVRYYTSLVADMATRGHMSHSFARYDQCTNEYRNIIDGYRQANTSHSNSYDDRLCDNSQNSRPRTSGRTPKSNKQRQDGIVRTNH